MLPSATIAWIRASASSSSQQSDGAADDPPAIDDQEDRQDPVHEVRGRGAGRAPQRIAATRDPIVQRGEERRGPVDQTEVARPLAEAVGAVLELLGGGDPVLAEPCRLGVEVVEHAVDEHRHDRGDREADDDERDRAGDDVRDPSDERTDQGRHDRARHRPTDDPVGLHEQVPQHERRQQRQGDGERGAGGESDAARASVHRWRFHGSVQYDRAEAGTSHRRAAGWRSPANDTVVDLDMWSMAVFVAALLMVLIVVAVFRGATDTITKLSVGVLIALALDPVIRCCSAGSTCHEASPSASCRPAYSSRSPRS